MAINDLGENRDGTIAIAPDWVSRCPSVVEVCVRKVGAAVGREGFRSGRFKDVTAELERLPAEVVYLLPFFKPGFADLHSGEDVRKGSLGSVYSIADFFLLDPDLVTPPEENRLQDLVERGLLDDADVADVHRRVPADESSGVTQPTLDDLLDSSVRGMSWGRQRLIQLHGRGELRALTRRAHELGKRVIFDLVLMQTSRDNPLVREHPEWYDRDEQGRPSIHQISWLVYSDVALFDLAFNEPLQEYLLEVAPYWIDTCDLDGVRIDASQTVDRPFLKRIVNRIADARDDALVLGETLCSLEEARDIPVHMIYALLVDFHRDMEHAAPLTRHLEEMHRSLAAGTVALAYFENHDSPRATEIWVRRFAEGLAQNPEGSLFWQHCLATGASPAPPNVDECAESMAALKNLQASLINASAGMAPVATRPGECAEIADGGESSAGTNLALGFEMGSQWGERAMTDFENATVPDPALRDRQAQARLEKAYEALRWQLPRWTLLRTGAVYYHRNEFAGGDPADRIFAYMRHDDSGALLLVHNLDFHCPRSATYQLEYLPRSVGRVRIVFDSYAALGATSPGDSAVSQTPTGLPVNILPLQSLVVELQPERN